MQRTCTGLGLILGWNNPYARLARDYCRWQVTLLPVALDAADIFFVHFPMLHCMCQMPPGAFLQKTAAEKCFDMAPVQYKPVVAEVIRRGANQFKGMCITMSEL
eukprot:331471-Rhodomonas_salina.1